jgi:uncharacterized membrane protein
MSESSDSQPPRLILPQITVPQIAALVIILLVAAFFRFSQITSASLWMDEIWTIEMAMGHGSVQDRLPQYVIESRNLPLTDPAHAAPWHHVWTHLDGYAHPPLYYILLRFWIDLFGAGALSVRSLSAIFSLISIVVLFDICRILSSCRFALLAAAIMTCSIAQIDAAQDARNYTLAMLFLLAAADALARVEVRGPSNPRLIALTLFTTAALLTHYFTAGAVAALALYAILRLRARARLLTLLSIVAAPILFLALWGYWMHRQFAAMPPGIPGFLAESPQHHALSTLLRVIGLPARFLFGESIARGMPVIPILAAAALVFVASFINLRRDRQILLWLLLLASVIGAAALTDLRRHSIVLEFIRYTIFASPAAYAILASFNLPRRPLVGDIVPILTIAILLFFAIPRTASPVPAKEDWRDLANQLNAAASPDDLLVFTNRDLWLTPGTWYLGLQYYTPGFKHPWLIINSPPNPALAQALRSRDHFWLIGLRPEIQAAQLLPGFQPREIITTSAGGACLLTAD